MIVVGIFLVKFLPVIKPLLTSKIERISCNSFIICYRLPQLPFIIWVLTPDIFVQSITNSSWPIGRTWVTVEIFLFINYLFDFQQGFDNKMITNKQKIVWQKSRWWSGVVRWTYPCSKTGTFHIFCLYLQDYLSTLDSMKARPWHF